MPAFDHILVAIVLAFAALAAWGDLRPMLPYVLGRAKYESAVHGRISNRLLFAWLLVGIAAVACGYLYVGMGGTFHAPEWIRYTEKISYEAALVINTVLSFALGVILWLLGLWAAGDAKMFALIAFTLPLSVYNANCLSYFPSFALFFNTFVAMFIILLAEFLVKTGLTVGKSSRSSLADGAKTLMKKGWANRWAIFKLIIFFLALFTTIRIMRHFIREGLDQFMEMNKTIIYVILFLMFKPLMRLAQKQWAFLLAVGIIVGYGVYAFFFDPTGEAKYEFINVGWLAASIIIFRFAYDAYLKATDEVEITPEQLRKGMILGDSEILKFKERKQFFVEKLGTLAPDGLSEDQAAAVRDWYRDNDADKLLSVARTIPFAPALLVGAILTVLSEGLVFVF